MYNVPMYIIYRLYLAFTPTLLYIVSTEEIVLNDTVFNTV